MSLPSSYARVRRVNSFHELISTRFENGVNALCWERTLPGDFGEIVNLLGTDIGITTLEENQLLQLPISAAGKIAVGILLEDQRLLREHGLDTVLDYVNGYLPNDDPSPLRTDVCSFHVDTATAEADTWLCTYHGASSEGLPNEDAQRHVDIPGTRAALLKHCGGEDNAEFLEYLSDHSFDLHYAPAPHARPYSFGPSILWRIAVDYPDCLVPRCIHRAPDPIPGQPRLLLIS